MNRSEILQVAEDIVTGKRQEMYGDAEDAFSLIADFWNAYLSTRTKCAVDLNGTDIAVLMSLLKVARQAYSPSNMDHYVDIAGYMACGGEIASRFEGLKAVKQGD